LLFYALFLCHLQCAKGHKQADCWQNKNQDGENKGGSENKGNGGDNGGFNGYCFICGKKGHRASDCRQKQGGNEEHGDQGHFIGYVGESPTVCIKCKEEATDQSNEYDKLDSFFDCLGGEDSDSLDKSKGFKAPKEEGDDAVPEWVDVEFSGEFLFGNNESKEEFDNGEDTVELNDYADEDSAMVTIGSRQEALLVREEVINNNNDECTG
jgi:hypothetical protein